MHNRSFFRWTFNVALLVAVALFLASLPNRTAAQTAPAATGKITEGSLLALDGDGKAKGVCPLKHTTVKAEISGFLSRVFVTQEFHNPFKEKIEAIYTFPLPQAAAVDDMTMQVGERTVKGKILRREQAQAVYQAARQNGQVASLLDQERPNIFTQSVANIMPGERVTVTLSYVETLKYEEGSYEFVFPMVVGKRYIPVGDGGPSDAAADATVSVPDAARISPPVMPEGMRAGHDISIEVALDAGLPVESLASVSHEIETARTSESRAVVRLKDEATIPNKDFVFKYDVAGRQLQDAVLAHRSAKGSFFSLIIQPPERVTVEDVTPKELVFVVDTSGSMQGFPLNKARETAKLALDNLNPQDTFNLITFSGDERVLFPQPVPATPENLSKAKEFLDSSRSEGGTEMMKAIRAALDPSDAADHIRIVCFMTDGLVGNDAEIIAEVRKHPNARVFAMGFSSSPNRFLLDRMAEYGRGEVDYVTEATDEAQAVARRFQERVRNPLLTDISIDWAGLPVADVYPQRIPDLFSARPVILTGRFTAGARGVVRLLGKMSGRDFVREIPVELPETEASHDVLAALWARQRIGDLTGRIMNEPPTSKVLPETQEEITQLGLEFRLMTQFTSFVAVEETIVTDGGEPRRVEVPVQAPVITTGPSDESIQYLQASYAVVAANVVTNSTGVVVEQQAASNLPFNGRSFKSLLLMPPGVVPTGTRQPANVAPNQFSVSGQRPTSNGYYVDGVSANFGIADGQNPGRTAAGIVPGLTASGGTSNLVTAESVLEVTIRTANLAPEYGRVAGGLFEITTRAGTNQFHGSLYEYFGNDALDANDWFANSRGLTKPTHRLNIFGGTFSGPLKRDRTFFFGAYEGLRLRQPSVGLTDVPSLSARSLAPLSLQPLLNAYPQPNGATRPDGFAEFAQSYANPARHDAASLRVDDMLTNNLRLFARYNYAPSRAEERGAGNSSLNTLNSTRSRTQTLTASLSYVVSPTVVTEVRGNYSRLNLRSRLRLDDFGGAVVPSAAPPSAFFDTNGGGVRSLFDLNGRQTVLAAADEIESVQRQFNLVGSVNQISGNHSFKYGADYRRLSPILGFEPFEQSVLFNRVAGALSGMASRVNLFARREPQTPVFHNLSLYAQDQWRANARLTLTYGVRWEMNPAPSSATERAPLAITNADDLTRLSFAASGAPLWETTYGNFAPRVGLAYQITQKNRSETIAYAGFDVHYDLGNEKAGLAFTDSPPFLGGQTLFDVPFAFAQPPPAFNPQATTSVPFVAFDPHLKLPYTLQWLFGVKQMIGSKQALSASYVGSAGRRLLRTETLLNPGPDFSLVRLTTNGAKSDYRAFELQYIRLMLNGLQATASYTWSRSIDDASEDSLAHALLAAGDSRQERGPSDFDVRHQVMGVLSYMLPTPKVKGASRALLRNWTIDAVFNARSARPVNVVYSVPTVYGFAYLRPDVRAGVQPYLEDAAAAGGRRLNPAAFEIPAQQRQGTSGRNSLRGFPLYQFDFALRRQFDFTEDVSLTFKAEVFNLFNHPNFEDPTINDVSLGSRLSGAGPFLPNTTFGETASMLGRNSSGAPGASFGSFYQMGGPRTFQFSLKLQF